MKWIEIDKDNLPEREVIAARIINGVIQDTLFGVINSLFLEYACIGKSHKLLLGATHYIDPKNIEMP